MGLLLSLGSAIINAAAMRFQVSQNTIVEHLENRVRGNEEDNDRWPHAKLDLKLCFLLNYNASLT